METEGSASASGARNSPALSTTGSLSESRPPSQSETPKGRKRNIKSGMDEYMDHIRRRDEALIEIQRSRSSSVNSLASNCSAANTAWATAAALEMEKLPEEIQQQLKFRFQVNFFNLLNNLI